MGGLETYVRQLVPALIQARSDLELSIFVGEPGRRLLADEHWPESVELVTHPLLGRPFTRALTETTLLGWLASRKPFDVLHSVALTGPLWTKPPTVITIADVTWLRQPDPADWLATALWRTIVPRVARRAERVTTLSEAARHEIVEDLRVRDERIDVIPCGPGLVPATDPTPETELRSRLRLGSGPVVFALSALKVHKNVGALVDAMAYVRRSIPRAVLVLAGNPTPRQKELEQRAAALGIGDAVVFPGWVDERDFEGLFRCAACFAFPSLREGFGLPVLEAMRRGVPVACSNASALPEVGGDAVLYFDPRHPEEIAAAIERLLGNREFAEALAAKGKARHRLFTWARAAEQTLASYDRARNSR